MNNQNSNLELLSKILIEESNSGFQNRTVIGGLDKFLARWSPEISPVIGEIPNYASLSSNQRKIWIHTLHLLASHFLLLFFLLLLEYYSAILNIA